MWEKLPDDLLLQLWQQAPPALLRHAMWFIGRHLAPDNALKERAKTYWDRRLQLGKSASNKDAFRKELGTIGVWFLWKVDQVIEIMRALVHQPDVEPWIFGSQEQSLRKVLEEGKKSASPATVAGVKEIM